jgi:myo-inositol-1(or 4)-monophosphatase
MSVASEVALIDSLVATGFPADRDGALPVNLTGLAALAPKVRNLRVAGSAALHLAYVAAGRLNGFWEIGLNAWDMAAGALLVEESGGRVTDTEGRPYSLSVRNVLASNGHIHGEFQQALAGAGALTV